MVKHAVALKIGMADAESILRRFTRTNIQHPAYKVFAELGKAIKTIFLCRYLASEDLRREINEGLRACCTTQNPAPRLKIIKEKHAPIEPYGFSTHQT